MASRIAQALENRKEKSAPSARDKLFFNHLLDATEDKLQLRSEILNNLMAGRDTTASMLSNAWFEIAKHPLVWLRLREEIATLNGSCPTQQQVLDMAYLRAIFLESMRLYPQLPENARMALSDTVLPLGGGKDGKSPIFVPKGKIIIWSSYALHRRRDIYGDDCNEFKPERWLNDQGQETLKPGWAYLAFGGGPRLCLGRKCMKTAWKLAVLTDDPHRKICDDASRVPVGSNRSDLFFTRERRPKELGRGSCPCLHKSEWL